MTLILPVVHHKKTMMTLEQAEIAFSSGADGLFLISHHGDDDALPSLAKTIKNIYPRLKVGVNLLSMPVVEAVRSLEPYGLDMVWSDYCGVSSRGFDKDGLELEKWHQNNKHVDLFASVAFKYQEVDSDPSMAAFNANQVGFIPTTSGEGTGMAPTLEKIKLMSEATHGNLAIASGMTPDNVESFVPYLSHILVSTGVSKNGYEFDEALLRDFVRKVKSSCTL